MPLLENGRIVQETWQKIQDEQPIPEKGNVLVPLFRLEEGLKCVPIGQLGIILTPEDQVRNLSHALPHLGMICLTFVSFRDGRPFTQACVIRRLLKYTGILRVQGYVLPDQYEFLRRCGIDQVFVESEHVISIWKRAYHRFSIAYQPSILDEVEEGFAFRRLLFSS